MSWQLGGVANLWAFLFLGADPGASPHAPWAAGACAELAWPTVGIRPAFCGLVACKDGSAPRPASVVGRLQADGDPQDAFGARGGAEDQRTRPIVRGGISVGAGGLSGGRIACERFEFGARVPAGHEGVLLQRACGPDAHGGQHSRAPKPPSSLRNRRRETSPRARSLARESNCSCMETSPFLVCVTAGRTTGSPRSL